MAQEALDKRIAFRLPENVADAWKAAAKASRLSLSDWVRMQVGTDKVPVVKTGKPTPAKMPKRSPAPEADPRGSRAGQQPQPDCPVAKVESNNSTFRPDVQQPSGGPRRCWPRRHRRASPSNGGLPD